MSSVLSTWFSTLSLVFGGCCSNAITLENITNTYPQSGTLITFLQFLVITLYCLPAHVQWTKTGPRLAERQIPFTPYVVQVVLFYFISLLNNWAFQYNVPMSIHIIFRSGGLVVSLIFGWVIGGKRYNLGQLLSVLIVSVGVLLTTLSASKPSKSTSESQEESELWTYFQGIAILSIALVLSGLLGQVQDYTYSNLDKWRQKRDEKQNASLKSKPKPRPTRTRQVVPVTPAVHATSSALVGSDDEDLDDVPILWAPPLTDKNKPKKSPPPWMESLFYLHFLALPLFWFVRQDITDQLHLIYTNSSKLPLTVPLPSWVGSKIPVPPPHTMPLSFKLSFSVLSDFLVVSSGHAGHSGAVLAMNIPTQIIPLLLNTITQLICVAGVHRLTTKVSSLSVTMILVLRKAVSLVLSVVDFGGFVPPQVQRLVGREPDPWLWWWTTATTNVKRKRDVDMPMMWTGAVLVLLGSIWYSVATSAKAKAKENEQKKEKKEQ